MRARTSSAQLGFTVALLVTLAGCATSRGRTHEARGEECQFTVVNRTGGPLAIRHIRERSAIEIGAISPNEQISSSAACVEGLAFIAGFPIPLQIGAPPASPPVFGSVELVRGARSTLSLFWP